MGRDRATIVAVEKQWVLHSLCLYICCNAHAPFCHVSCPAL